jgi:hypothetical protein
MPIVLVHLENFYEQIKKMNFFRQKFWKNLFVKNVVKLPFLIYECNSGK